MAPQGGFIGSFGVCLSSKTSIRIDMIGRITTVAFIRMVMLFDSSHSDKKRDADRKK